MKAIILAAGKWTRLQPITLKKPKAMVEVHGKSLLEHNMDKLLLYVDEFIIVVKYKKEMITNHFWNEYKGVKIRYHEQWEKIGTGGALIGLEVSGNCFIIASDTIYTQTDIDTIAQTPWYAALCQKVENPEKWGIFVLDENENIIKVIEKPQKYIWNLASLFYFKIDSQLIDLCKNISPSQRWEYELTDALNIFIKKHKVHACKIQNDFIDITSIEDVESANILIKPKLGETQYLENIWEYEIHLGIPKYGIQEIVNYTLDESDIALREWTGDWKKRFISVKNLSSWYNDEDRYPFTLLSKDGVVAGIWWGRPAKLPNITEIINRELYNLMIKNEANIHTSWIRIYPFARGKRLTKPFMKACERYYKCIFQNVYMSDDIACKNIASLKAFEGLGYKQVWYGKNINNSPESGKKRFIYIKKF